MFRMEVDSSPETSNSSPQDRILQRLAGLVEIHEEDFRDLQPELLPAFVTYVKDNEFPLQEVVPAILPSDAEVVEAIAEGQKESRRTMYGSTVEDIFHESMIWLQWLMFEGDPSTALEQLAEMNGYRGVCGAVWGNNDIAYRCRTCEHDPTCAICVPCFQNGNHKDHDYSIIYTGGGCCDCGDITAWKREGFCSKHKGAEQIQPLPEKFAKSLGPVLDSLLQCWKEKLFLAQSISEESPREDNDAAEVNNVADEVTSAILEMLLEFCKNSESLLSFISQRVFSSVGLLDVLVRAEMFLNDDVTGKLHELLLKFLGEPQFKYEFAKVFLGYYPAVVKEAIKENSDEVYRKYPLVSTFSVQILTVPTLTPRLVKEMNLLAILLDCLEDIFISSAGEDGRLQVSKWVFLYETTLRVVEDIRFVMSHSDVPNYVTHDRRDISRTWMRLLAYVQGWNPQKRETGIHVEEENENMHLPFVLGHSIANIHSLLVTGAFSGGIDEETDEEALNMYKQEFVDQDSVRHAKVGRLSQESSVSSMTGRNAFDHALNAPEMKYESFPLQSSVVWLTFECLKALENWLQVDNTSGPLVSVLSPKTSHSSGNNFFALRRTLSKFRRGRHIFKSNAGPSNSKSTTSGDFSGKHLLSSANGSNVGVDSKSGRGVQEAVLGCSDDSGLDGAYASDLEALRVLSLSDWPDIVYDVSSQDISVHIPLHRLLSMILQRALRKCYGESTMTIAASPCSAYPLSAISQDFFGHIIGGCHPHGFSAFLMEHPLRIRVFCAEVHAGMWRRNGDAAILSCEWYRSVRWSEQGLEFDLFLLQCCAALAPADLYAQRILERFGLSSYLSLNIERSSEYEPILVQEMLTLIIQIIKERRFSGLNIAESLQRELIYTLSIGDATHSHLVKSLPRDLSKVDKLKEILDAVADYSNPSGMNQGMYKLKLQYWKELDLYHPRWNPRDLQVAEERYLRFCNFSALTNQLPKWTKIYHPLRGIARIATCKTVIQIVRAVLFYAVFTEKLSASRAPDGVLIAALHLLSLALDICLQKEFGDRLCHVDDVIPVLAFAGEEICMNRYGDQSLLSLLVLLMRMHQKQTVDNLREPGNFNLSSVIENILKKFAELEPECLTKLQKLAPDVVSQLSQSIAEGEINGMALESDVDKRKAKARERQAAIMEKMKAQQSKFLASIDSSLDDDMDDKKVGIEASDSDVGHQCEESTQVICSLCHDSNSKSPLSYLILLQKSRLLSFVDRALPSWDQGRCSGKELASTSSNILKVSSQGSSILNRSEVVSPSEMLHAVQTAVNQFAVDGQPGEVNALLEYIKTCFPSLKNLRLPSMASNYKEKTVSSLDNLEEHIHKMIREEMHNTLLRPDFLEDVVKLPLTGGSQAAESNTESLFLGKYIAALSKETLENASGSDNSLSRDGKSQSKSVLLPVYDGIGPSDCDGIYLTSCGHAVHQGCLDRYLSSLKERFMRRIVFEGGHIVDPDQGEFLCPVCRGLANSVLPALSGNSRKVSNPKVVSNISQSDAAAGSLTFPDRKANSLHLREALSLLRSAADVAGRDEILRAFTIQGFEKMKLHVEPVFQVLCGMYFPSKDKVYGSGGVSQSLILWDTLKYSLVSTEIAARSRKSSLTPNYSLSALYKELKSSNGFILSLLHNIVQSIRTMNSVSSLSRLKGIQLFGHSICSGVSLDKFSNPSSGQGGYVQQILEQCGTEVQRREIQLWMRASDPIIARDPFSSLMWILFCLPNPFMTCEDSFWSLVHMFYVVIMTQAAITYCRRRGWSSTELGYQDCLITDIYKFMTEYEVAVQYFESNHIDSSYNMKDAIRSLSFPFLRRCALLWKLINSSTSAPFSDGIQVSDGSSWVGDDRMEFTNNSVEELAEVEKFEKFFKIPSFDVVIKDELSRSVVFRWLRHFSKEFEARTLPRALHFTPAIPFKLMLLPRLYQDLLQRYIKHRCPDCGVIQEEPALCLLCGKLCSPNWKTCCRESGCQSHANVCGAGTGVFLLIRKTTVLLQRSARQALWPSPYLDAFGEEDSDMKRGKPLYLNEERCAALTHMVASHGLDRSSKVLRQTTIGAFFML